MYEDLNDKENAVLEFLKDHITQKGYPPSVREICRKLEIKSTSTVFTILNNLEKLGYIRKDPAKTRALVLLSKSYGSTSTDEQVSMNLETISIPVLGRIAAGAPILAEENIEEYLPFPASLIRGGNCFVLRVNGDSMTDAGIFDQDYLIVDSDRKNPRNGDIIAAMVNDESATVKRFKKDGDKIFLIPENELFPIQIYRAEQVKILGKVRGVFRSL